MDMVLRATTIIGYSGGVNRVGKFASVMLFAVLVAMLFGGFAHAVTPHTHNHHSEITDLTHASLHFEGKQVYDLFVLQTLSILTTSLGVLILIRWLMLVADTVRAQLPAMVLLRNGVAQYRRFR